MRVLYVDKAEDDHRQDEDESQPQVGAEHHHVKPVLVGEIRIVLNPFQKTYRAEINRIGGEHRRCRKNEIEQNA